MALSNMRDISIITTPPAKRLSVKTFSKERDKTIICEAIRREMLRGGQIYFVHNRVKTIHTIARELAEWIPEARIAVAHGQMHERELEYIMRDFYHQRYHILLCTTIIESGIDIPTANTIIIDRADRFGLAQLHQLRGRVGRSHHQAYAYLLTPPPKLMTSDATKRLDAIQSLEDLGAGFMLATHDLEIRGAGELLGDEQSGQMQSIGFELYMDLLQRAVRDLKAGKTLGTSLQAETSLTIDLSIAALIPEDYIPDVPSRLVLYKRIATAQNQEALDELQVEMIDRFGMLPEATKHLFTVTKLKLQLTPLGVKKLSASGTGGFIEFDSQANIDPQAIIKLLTLHPKRFSLSGGERLRYQYDSKTAQERLEGVQDALEVLKTCQVL